MPKNLHLVAQVLPKPKINFEPGFEHLRAHFNNCSQSITQTLCLVTCSRSEGLAFSFRFSSIVCIKFLRSSEAFCSASFLCFSSSIAASLSAFVGTWEADYKREITLKRMRPLWLYSNIIWLKLKENEFSLWFHCKF